MCSNVGLDCGFWTTRDGILKVIQFVLSLLILILTSASRYTENFGYTDRDGNAEIVPTQQMTYVNFVGSFCCITLLISMIIYLLKLYNLPLCGKLPWGKMEVVFCGVCTILNFIGMAVAANAAVRTNVVGLSTLFGIDFYGLYSADAVFSAALTIIFAIHAFLIVRGPPPRSETAQERPKHGSSVPT